MLRSIGSTWVVTLLTMAATYVLTPFVIETLGRDGYGTWNIIASLTGYISVLALGVPMACVRHLAQHAADRDNQRMNAAIGTCAGLYLIIGVLALAAGGILAAVFAAFYDVPAALRNEATVAFGLMVVQVAAGFIGFLPEGILFAHHDFVARNLVRAGGVVLRLGLTLGLLWLDASLVTLAAVQIACLAFDMALSWTVIRRRHPHIRLRLDAFDPGIMRQIFSFSLYVLLVNAGTRLSFETAALVIGARMSVDAVPFFTIPNSLVIYLMEFVVGIAAVVSPMATTMHAAGELARLREMFLTWSKVALSVSMAAGLFLMVLGPRFIGWWIDPSFEQPAGEVLQILTVSYLAFLPVRGVALPILIGIGRPKAATIAFAAAGLLNLGLSVILIGPFGLAGVAIGTAVPNVLFAGVVLAVACRDLQIGVGEYVRYVVPRATLGALPVLALLLWFRLGLDVSSIAGLVAAGSAMTVLFGVTWIFFVYRDDPYVDLRPHLGRLLVWSSPRL